MKTNQTDAKLIELAKRMLNGTDFKVVIKSTTFADDWGHQKHLTFKAVEFTAITGERRFISEMFL